MHRKMHSLYHVIIDTCFMYYFNCLCNQYFTGSPLRKSYHWQIWWTKAMQSRLFITAWSVYNGRTLLPLIRGFVCKKNLNVIKECVFYFLKIQDILLFCIFEEIVKSVHINPSLPPPPFFLGHWTWYMSRSCTSFASATYFETIRFWQNNYDDILNKNTIDCKVQIHSGNTQKWFNSCSGALLL